MIKLAVPEQNVVNGLRAFGTPAVIRRDHNEFFSLARNFGALSRPSLVRVGLAACRENTQSPSFSSYERFATLISTSRQLTEQSPSTTAWAWDQIGRNVKTNQVEFGKAISVFQSLRNDALLLNMARTHALWQSILQRDNLGTEINTLLQDVPQDVHGNTGNWVFWAAQSIGGTKAPGNLAHDVHNFSVFLNGRLMQFENGYDTIGSLCGLVEKLGSAVDKNASRVISSEAPDEEKMYAERVQKSVSHAMDIAEAYRNFLPTEVLVYSSNDSNAEQNNPEAVTCLLKEDERAKAFAGMMERANTRMNCLNGTATVMRWHGFFEDLMKQSPVDFDLLQFREDPIVASYLSLKGL